MSSPNPISPIVRPFPKIADSRPSLPSKPRMPEHRLTVKEVLDDLVADGLIAKADADLWHRVGYWASRKLRIAQDATK